MRRPEKKKIIPKKKWNGLEIIVMICAIGIIVFQVFFVVFKTGEISEDFMKLNFGTVLFDFDGTLFDSEFYHGHFLLCRMITHL